MARTTVADLEARIDGMTADFDKLVSMVSKLAANTVQQQQQPKPEPKPEKPWLSPCPDYATAAQRVEYDKLAAKAASIRDAVSAATGTYVTAFIPVPKKQSLMPHSINWKTVYK